MAITKKKIMAAAIVAGTCGTASLWLYAEQLDNEHEALVADQVEVVKAARNIPAHTSMTKDRITTEKVPRKYLPPNPLLESELNIYLGTPVMKNVEEGAMILTSDFSVKEVSRGLPPVVSPLVIKTATLSVRAESPSNSGQAAIAAIAANGGYIVMSDIEVGESWESFAMTARVPAAKFEEVVFSMNELGTPVTRRIRGAGVSGDVQRLERKLGNTEFMVEGLRFAQKSAKKQSREVDTIEIIRGDDGDSTVHSRTVKTHDNGAEIAKEIAVANHEKAEIEDQLMALHEATALATIELTISEPLREFAPPPPPVELTVSEELSAEFASSSRSLMRGGFKAVRAFAASLPYLIFISPFCLAAAFWRRRRKQLV